MVDLAGFMNGLAYKSLTEVLLRGVLFVEFALGEAIKSNVPKPEHLKLDGMSLSAKADMAAAVVPLSERDLAAVRRLRKARNKFAHDLDYELDGAAVEMIVGDWSRLLKDPSTPWGASISERAGKSAHKEESAVILADFIVFLGSNIVGTGKEQHFRRRMLDGIESDPN